jgi:uncharacterized cupredoxin-like copper-binding protein
VEEEVKQGLVVSLFIVFVFLFAACGGNTQQEVRIDIDMGEYSFSPEDLNLKVGQQVTINLINSGQLQHEVMFGREMIKVDNRPAGYMEDMFAAGGVEPQVTQVGEPEAEHDDETMHSGFMVALPPEGTATITFAVTEGMLGEWEMGCFEQDGVHYDAGMIGSVSVTQ